MANNTNLFHHRPPAGSPEAMNQPYTEMLRERALPPNKQLPASDIHLHEDWYVPDELLPNGVPFQINIRTPLHLQPYVQICAAWLVKNIQDLRGVSPLRIFLFNYLSRNGWQNPEFDTALGNMVEWFEVLISDQGWTPSDAAKMAAEDWAQITVVELTYQFPNLLYQCPPEVMNLIKKYSGLSVQISNTKDLFYRKRDYIAANAAYNPNIQHWQPGMQIPEQVQQQFAQETKIMQQQNYMQPPPQLQQQSQYQHPQYAQPQQRLQQPPPGWGGSAVPTQPPWQQQEQYQQSAQGTYFARPQPHMGQVAQPYPQRPQPYTPPWQQQQQPQQNLGMFQQATPQQMPWFNQAPQTQPQQHQPPVGAPQAPQPYPQQPVWQPPQPQQNNAAASFYGQRSGGMFAEAPPPQTVTAAHGVKGSGLFQRLVAPVIHQVAAIPNLPMRGKTYYPPNNGAPIGQVAPVSEIPINPQPNPYMPAKNWKNRFIAKPHVVEIADIEEELEEIPEEPYVDEIVTQGPQYSVKGEMDKHRSGLPKIAKWLRIDESSAARLGVNPKRLEELREIERQELREYERTHFGDPNFVYEDPLPPVQPGEQMKFYTHHGAPLSPEMQAMVDLPDPDTIPGRWIPERDRIRPWNEIDDPDSYANNLFRGIDQMDGVGQTLSDILEDDQSLVDPVFQAEIAAAGFASTPAMAVPLTSPTPQENPETDPRLWQQRLSQPRTRPAVETVAPNTPPPPAIPLASAEAIRKARIAKEDELLDAPLTPEEIALRKAVIDPHRPCDFFRTSIGDIVPAHISTWERSWTTLQPYDYAWDPSYQIKFLRKDDDDEVHEMVEVIKPNMEYLKHEIQPNLKCALPPSVEKIAPNEELLKSVQVFEQLEDKQLQELKTQDIKNTADTLKIKEIFWVRDKVRPYYDATMFLVDNDLLLERGKRPIEYTYYNITPHYNQKVGDTDLKTIFKAISEIQTIDEYVDYLNKLATNRYFPDEVLNQLIDDSTAVVNSALSVGLNMDIWINSINNDWQDIKNYFYETLGEEIGEEYLMLMQLKYGERIINGGQRLVTEEEEETCYQEDGPFGYRIGSRAKTFLMINTNVETIMPWRAADFSICFTDGVGCIAESVLPKLYEAIDAIYKRNTDKNDTYNNYRLVTKDGKVLEIHRGIHSKKWYVLKEVDAMQ
jgi:hypothetical protein